jgi:hypothetical protein
MTIYDVTILTVRPGMHPAALGALERSLAAAASAGKLLACWYSDLGAINQVLLIRAHEDGEALVAQRASILQSRNPLGIGEFIVGMTMDTYLSFPFITPMAAGQYGPVYEVRTYMLKPDALAATIEAWRKAVPGRVAVSPLLAAMYAVSGPVIRFMHIWPYASLDERARLRAKAVADGVWPPPGGPDLLLAQQADIFFPADFSPMR